MKFSQMRRIQRFISENSIDTEVPDWFEALLTLREAHTNNGNNTSIYRDLT